MARQSFQTAKARLCPACGGTGQRQRDTSGTPPVTCFWCGGRGEVAE